jgi:DNA adenine methylase
MCEQASAWLSAVEGLPAVHARLARVAILNRPALDVIREMDAPGTLYYLDPPYLHSTRTDRTIYGDFEMSAKAHRELLDVLSGIKGKFLLSGYRSDLYDRRAARNGWDRIEFDRPNNAAHGKIKRRVVECLWSNYTLPRTKGGAVDLI